MYTWCSCCCTASVTSLICFCESGKQEEEQKTYFDELLLSFSELSFKKKILLLQRLHPLLQKSRESLLLVILLLEERKRRRPEPRHTARSFHSQLLGLYIKTDRETGLHARQKDRAREVDSQTNRWMDRAREKDLYTIFYGHTFDQHVSGAFPMPFEEQNSRGDDEKTNKKLPPFRTFVQCNAKRPGTRTEDPQTSASYMDGYLSPPHVRSICNAQTYTRIYG